MTRGLTDTSVFIARQSGRRLEEAALPDELAISVITVAELRVGVLAATALALDIPVVTQDDDYVDLEGLAVIKV